MDKGRLRELVENELEYYGGMAGAEKVSLDFVFACTPRVVLELLVKNDELEKELAEVRGKNVKREERINILENCLQALSKRCAALQREADWLAGMAARLCGFIGSCEKCKVFPRCVRHGLKGKAGWRTLAARHCRARR